MLICDDLASFFSPDIRHWISQQTCRNLIDIVVDLGRPITLRYSNRIVKEFDRNTTSTDLDHILNNCPYFDRKNRFTPLNTLHRISAVRSVDDTIIGITIRYAHMPTHGLDLLLDDIIDSEQSLLIIGAPGKGKTTLLRTVAARLADRAAVVVVDKSNEIAGSNIVPHECIGRARRLMVPHHKTMDEVLLEAVENHTPEILVVDEISTQKDCMAMKTIAERGIVVIATAHGSDLESVVNNPVFSKMLGGSNIVTFGDDEAQKRKTTKTVRQRDQRPIFDCIVTLRAFDQIDVYHDVSEHIDAIFSDKNSYPEVRRLHDNHCIVLMKEEIKEKVEQ